MNKISVVTICFNNPDELKKTVESVNAQTLAPFEHLIIDGSSNSAIREWLESAPQPDFRLSVHERDEGIADAFNKGIAKATGNIIHLLNSGDMYENPNVLNNVCAAFASDTSLMWVSGILKTLRANSWVYVGKPFEAKKLYRGMRSVFHPTWFVKKEVYDRVGAYDNRFKIAMDYDMLCRISKERYRFLDIPVAVFDPGGISSVRYLDSLQETKKVYEKHFGSSGLLILWQMRLRLLHSLLQSPAGKFLYAIKRRLKLENF